jgi:hypothetical protein
LRECTDTEDEIIEVLAELRDLLAEAVERYPSRRRNEVCDAPAVRSDNNEESEKWDWLLSLEAHSHGQVLAVYPDDKRPNAWRREPFIGVLRSISVKREVRVRLDDKRYVRLRIDREELVGW